jgi:hypothetical protein
MAHYAEAFSVIPGQCFRFVHNGVGHASHCEEPIVRGGRFTDGNGKRWTVEACAEHADELALRDNNRESGHRGPPGRH